MNTVKVNAEDNKWKIEDDLRTLVSAGEIQKDKKRMDAVKKLAKEKMAGMKKIGGQETEETK